jgi:hypothetical protein
MAKRLRVHHPSDWFVKGRGKPYVPATWEGWIIFLGLLSLPFILALIESDNSHRWLAGRSSVSWLRGA